MTELVLATLRSQARRYLGPGLAVVLGVAFVATTLVLSATVTASVRAALAGDLGRWSAVATPAAGSAGRTATLPEGTLGRVRALPEAARVDPVRRGVLAPIAGSGVLVVSTPPAAGGPARLSAGRAPTRRGEVALSAESASALNLGLGDRFTAGRVEATVVGLVDTSGDPSLSGSGAVFGVAEEVTALTGAKGWDELRVDGTPGTSPAAVVTAVQGALGSSASVRSGNEAADEAVARMTGGRNVLTIFLLAFAAVSLLVSAIVIATTFSVLLARRARETALLRAVGATRSQVLRAALLEAAALGLLGALGGVALGAAAARGLAAAASSAGLGIPLTSFELPLSAVLVPTAVGVLVTVLAALLPVARSARISPMAALRPAPAPHTGTRPGRLRVRTGLLLGVAGAALLVAGAVVGVLPVAVLGGAASFLGVLLVGTVLLPPLARLLGAVPARTAGVPGAMAVENTVRQPGRAAATASALLVGVTLIVMMSVGAATAERSITASLDERYPVDVAVTAVADLPAATVQHVSSLEGVARSVALPGLDARVGSGAVVEVLALPPEVGDVVRGGAVGAPAPGRLMVSAQAAEAQGLGDGEPTTLVADGRRVPVTVEVSDTSPTPFAVAVETLHRLAPGAGTRAVLVRLDAEADAGAVVAQTQGLVASDGATVAGGAPARADLERLVATSLAVVTALLAVSVVIAVVGIGTSLSLSVIERTRELGLLRALGLTRGQLAGMLAGESVLLAAVATVLGSALGIAYGIAGPMSLFGDAVVVLPDVPWGRLALVGLGAVACGLLASVLPARRATRVAPVAALAEE
ncbi:ABC transporter permease [Phycicoccus endophyticus]|uniref:ABC transporter permease n=1 Tax=Phycicoccus endophyticus TaxID=1690220 RepID=A0A7G9R163_9MICO|nr:FtsX-like permease family protein [Phycicoccus endophyticus]NHI20530.1 ABC transporter permease [Phycicoccus endophyticus]QNN49338.1 ABC transporter permease [Phycicoccus endophyticus]GGL45252.1 ABC transporter permease [Phycicoccus endophyticus]